jgi:type I restriction enzyme R subunit
MPTNITEKGLETLIVDYLRDQNGYEEGSTVDFNTDYALDTARVEAFLRATQPQKVAESLAFASPYNKHTTFSNDSKTKLLNAALSMSCAKAIVIIPICSICIFRSPRSLTIPLKNNTKKKFLV